MKETKYFTITFNDLSEDKQLEIADKLKKEIKENIEVMEFLMRNTEDVDDDIYGAVKRGCESSWCEMEVNILL